MTWSLNDHKINGKFVFPIKVINYERIFTATLLGIRIPYTCLSVVTAPFFGTRVPHGCLIILSQEISQLVHQRATSTHPPPGPPTHTTKRTGNCRFISLDLSILWQSNLSSNMVLTEFRFADGRVAVYTGRTSIFGPYLQPLWLAV